MDITAVEATVITIPAYKLARFQNKVAAANRRLEAAGVEARFSFSYAEIQVKKIVGGIVLDDGTRFGGTEVFQPWINATLESELDLSIGDYTFLATLVSEEAGITVHTAPGHELGGFVPAGDDHCDHCNTDRRRTRLYLVRNNVTGEIIQLGHSCIEVFLGFSPKGLFALQYDEELRGLGSDDEVGGFTYKDTSADVNRVIALAYAYSNEGRAYVSSKVDWKVSTGQAVKHHIFEGAPKRPLRSGAAYEAEYQKDLARYTQAVTDSERYLADEALIADLRAAADTLDTNSDYGRNFSVILAGQTVSTRNVGILASIVAVYARNKQLAAERAAAPAKVQGFLAPVGTRIKVAINLTVKIAKQSEGDYGWSTWIVGTTPEGNTVTWRASRAIDLEPGDTLVLSAATVKAHETYQGTDQTVLTRAKIAE